MTDTTCPACGFPGDYDGPTHAYMSPTPACWAMYGEVLAREYSDAAYWSAHRLLTDAYCGQHSISEDRRARQSLWLHLAALSVHFENAAPDKVIVDFLRRAAKSGHDFPSLQMPDASRAVDITGVHGAGSAKDHADAVARYARCVYDAWEPHRPAFQSLIAEVGI